MLKGSQITALALTLASLLVGISTEIAYAKQSTGHTVDVVEGSGETPSDRRCIRKPGKPCPVINPPGNTPPSNVNGSGAPIQITRPELNDVTSAVAIEKLEALKSSGQATNDDYILLGYFYSLEKKYDLSEANYLKALELATDVGRKAIIEQELKKIRAVMREPELGGETKL
jgi:hypothetical protein